MADTDAAQAAPKANDNNKSATAAPDGDVKVRLLARMWQRPVPDSKPLQYKRYRKGDVLTVSRAEFEQLNAGLKLSFEEVTD